MSTAKPSLPVALSIASSDSGAGAGVQADLLSFAACGVFGTTALAATTAQSPDGVAEVAPLPPKFLKAQLEQLAGYFQIGACKTGMLPTGEHIEAAAHFLKKCSCPVVVDPVMVASSGDRLVETAAITALKQKLFAGATLITPNLNEASVLLGQPVQTPADMRAAARRLMLETGTACLLKGGHLPSSESTLLDVLILTDGELIELTAPRLSGVNSHGSGCTLSAAIAAYLAKGLGLPEAAQRGHMYLQACFSDALQLKKERFLNHFPRRHAGG
jgi:hydroxymethylpyrimidine/phosphomethylpyrimidine kinase